jgi:hypothetical protein
LNAGLVDRVIPHSCREDDKIVLELPELGNTPIDGRMTSMRAMMED